MTTAQTANVKGRTRALTLVLAVAVAVLTATVLGRPEKLVSTLEDWEIDVFQEAALERADLVDNSVASAIDLLNSAGFNGEEISSELLLAGVSSKALVLPNYSPFELAPEQERQKMCLAQGIYFEARNQPVLGRIAVADVILNRVEDRRFPDTICGVVFQGQGRSYGCQFSFACDGSMDKAREPLAWDRAEKLADLIYRGFKPDLTRFATFYHADYVVPYWAKEFNQAFVVGDHIFYRLPGAIELAANQMGIDLSDVAS